MTGPPCPARASRFFEMPFSTCLPGPRCGITKTEPGHLAGLAFARNQVTKRSPGDCLQAMSLRYPPPLTGLWHIESHDSDSPCQLYLMATRPGISPPGVCRTWGSDRFLPRQDRHFRPPWRSWPGQAIVRPVFRSLEENHPGISPFGIAMRSQSAPGGWGRRIV